MQPGARIGQYDLQSRLGSGGMGEVWKAWDPKLERAVAIKILRDRSGDVAGRVLAEARAASALSHPNVCTVYEVGEIASATDAAEGQTSFIAMEFVAGKPVSEIIPPGSRSTTSCGTGFRWPPPSTTRTSRASSIAT